MSIYGQALGKTVSHKEADYVISALLGLTVNTYTESLEHAQGVEVVHGPNLFWSARKGGISAASGTWERVW